MRAATHVLLDRWYADVFDVLPGRVWEGVTARPHRRLGDYPGFYVAWRGDGVHVSLPEGVEPSVVRRIEETPSRALRTPAFWLRLATERDSRVIGPATHTYLDTDPGPVDGVVPLSEEGWSRPRAAAGPRGLGRVRLDRRSHGRVRAVPRGPGRRRGQPERLRRPPPGPRGGGGPGLARSGAGHPGRSARHVVRGARARTRALVRPGREPALPGGRTAAGLRDLVPPAGRALSRPRSVPEHVVDDGACPARDPQVVVGRARRRPRCRSPARWPRRPAHGGPVGSWSDALPRTSSDRVAHPADHQPGLGQRLGVHGRDQVGRHRRPQGAAACWWSAAPGTWPACRICSSWTVHSMSDSPPRPELEVGGRVRAARQPLVVDARLDPADLPDVGAGSPRSG